MEEGQVIQKVIDTVKGGVLNTAEQLYQGVEEKRSRLFSQSFSSDDFVTFTVWALGLWIVRVVLLKALVKVGRSEYAENHRITKKPVINDKQLERESVWKYGFFFDFLGLLLIYVLGIFQYLPVFNLKALFINMFWHATVVEFIYYWWHRALHWGPIYKRYHQYHHKSINTEPTTGLSFEIGERLSYTVLFALAPALTALQGYQSLVGVVSYYIWFDFMNEGGHINFDPLPEWFHRSALKYVFYSPSFHSVHHTRFKRNYSLFMPWCDMVFRTCTFLEDLKSSAHSEGILPTNVAETGSNNNNQQQKPLDFILLVHPGHMPSVMWSRWVTGPVYRWLGLERRQYYHPLWLNLFYPFIIIANLYMLFLDQIGFHKEDWFSFYPRETPCDDIEAQQNTGAPASMGSTTTVAKRTEFFGSTWIIHNPAATYVFPRFKKQIISRIESAVLEAQKEGVRVVGLGNFNKAEWINHGGTDLVERLKGKLKGTVIAHGDTLSAATVFQTAKKLKDEGYWSRGVMITGSTSKIGRAVVLSLANMGIRVVMLTQCKERFDEIAAEAPEEVRHNLVCASDLSAGKSCDLWLTGKMIPYGRELIDAIPQNAVVVNFSVPDPLTPKLFQSRPDLLHLDTGLLAFDPQTFDPKFTWLLPRGVMYACLAGGIVHSVLGINSHEIGPVIVADMQKYWDAAQQIGFKIPQPSSFYVPITMPPPRHI